MSVHANFTPFTHTKIEKINFHHFFVYKSEKMFRLLKNFFISIKVINPSSKTPAIIRILSNIFIKKETGNKNPDSPFDNKVTIIIRTKITFLKLCKLQCFNKIGISQ
jgi:hypothetical protein